MDFQLKSSVIIQEWIEPIKKRKQNNTEKNKCAHTRIRGQAVNGLWLVEGGTKRNNTLLQNNYARVVFVCVCAPEEAAETHENSISTKWLLAANYVVIVQMKKAYLKYVRVSARGTNKTFPETRQRRQQRGRYLRKWRQSFCPVLPTNEGKLANS